MRRLRKPREVESWAVRVFRNVEKRSTPHKTSKWGAWREGRNRRRDRMVVRERENEKGKADRHLIHLVWHY